MGHQVQLTELYGNEAFHDRDPWTGVWMLVKDKQRTQGLEQLNKFARYKFRKIGDSKLVGCMLVHNKDVAEIGGALNQKNFKKCKMEVSFKRRRSQNARRVWNCELIPPQSFADAIVMNVKWEEINKGSASKKQGLCLSWTGYIRQFVRVKDV